MAVNPNETAYQQKPTAAQNNYTLRDKPQNLIAGVASGGQVQSPAQQINNAMQTASAQTPQQQAPAQQQTPDVQASFNAASKAIASDARQLVNQLQQAQKAAPQQPTAQNQMTAQTTQEATGNIYKVGSNGQGPKGMKVGDQVVTATGTYTVMAVNPDGSYQSKLTNPNQTTGNYAGKYANAPVAPNNVYRVGADGKAPTGLKVGDQVVTAGGTYQITGVNADGTYQSQLVNRDQTTANYTGAYANGQGTAPATTPAAQAKQPEVPSFAKGYNPDLNYTTEIENARARGDLVAAAYYEQQRNAKIDAEGLGDKYAKTNLYSQYLSQLTPERQAQLSGGYVAASSYPENPRDRWMQWADEWAKNQKGLVDTQIDYATNQGILEAQRAEEDAQPKFQQQLNQNDIDTARAMSNSALYAEMRGDRGGIGQSQYNEVQAAGLRAKQEINSARTKLATDTARAIADLRSKGEFQKAESYMKIQNELMAKYFEIENAILNYGISRAEYEQAKEQADFNRDYQIANLMGTYKGQPTYSAQKYEQENAADIVKILYNLGLPISDETLRKAGLSDYRADVDRIVNAMAAQGLGFSSGAGSSSGSSSGGNGSGTPYTPPQEQTPTKARNAALDYSQPKDSAPTPWQKPVKGYDM